MTTMDIPARVHRAASLDIRADENGGQSVAVSISSEFAVQRFFGREILGHKAGEVELSAFGGRGLPLLADHGRSIGDVLGRVVNPRLEGGKLRAELRFSDHAEAQAARAKVLDGTLGEISVGYSIEEMALIEEGRTRSEDVWRATKWTPREASLVAVPADYSVGVGRSDEGATTRVAIIKEGRDMPDTEDKTRAAATGENEPKADKAKAKPAEAARGDAAASSEEAARKAVSEGLKAERARTKAINELAAKFGVPAGVRDDALSGGLSVAAFQGVILDHMGDGARDVMNASTAVGLTEREAESFSLRKLILAQAQPGRERSVAPFEMEVCDAAKDKAMKDGRREPRGALVPSDVLGRFMSPAMAQRAAAAMPVMGRAANGQSFVRDLIVGDKGSGTGGQTVDTMLMAGEFIDILRNRLALADAGARILDGLSGDVAIPKQSVAATGYWVGENVAPTESLPQITQVALTPHTAAGWTNYSRKLLIQSSIDVEAFIRNDLARVLAILIDKCALEGSADGDAPDGIADGIGSGVNTVDFSSAAAPTWAEVMELWSAIATDNADVNTLSWIMGPAMKGYLMSTPKVDGDSMMMMGESGTMAGLGARHSSQVTAGDLWLGDWSSLIMAFWSGLDIMVDPYSLATSGATRVVAMQDVDFGLRHAESFCRGQ